MVIFWPDFYADHDGTNGFWKIFDFAQNNPIYKFDTFWANISVYKRGHGPKFGLRNWISTRVCNIRYYQTVKEQFGNTQFGNNTK